MSSRGRFPPRLLRIVGWSLGWLVLANVVVERLNLHWWAARTHGPLTARVEEALDEDRKLDVLLIGSSHVQTGLLPSVIEEELRTELGREVGVYNLGTPGASVDRSAALLDIVLRERAPELVVLGLCPAEVIERAEMLELFYRDACPPSWAVREIVEGRVTTTEALRLNVRSFFRAPALPWQWALGRPGHDLDRQRARQHSGARVQRQRSTRIGVAASTFRREVLRDYAVAERHDRYLEEIVTLTGSHDVSLLVVRMPFSPHFTTLAFRERENETFDDYLATRRAELGIACVDLDTPSYQPHHLDYLDGHHLMVDGARVVSRRLARRELAPRLSPDPG
ncbi:MAG: hypothetical protein AAF533_15785 [Acidobacteriota bacterium]